MVQRKLCSDICQGCTSRPLVKTNTVYDVYVYTIPTPTKLLQNYATFLWAAVGLWENCIQLKLLQFCFIHFIPSLTENHSWEFIRNIIRLLCNSVIRPLIVWWGHNKASCLHSNLLCYKTRATTLEISFKRLPSSTLRIIMFWGYVFKSNHKLHRSLSSSNFLRKIWFQSF